MLWVIAFLCGAIVMALEIAGGARLLAPYFGSGAITWASVISVFLAGLSLGYFLGGMIADRFPTPHGLGLLLLGASATIAFVVPLETWLFPQETTIGIGGIPMPSESIFERMAGRYGVLLAAITLFLLPSVLLGTVSPYLIRLASKRVETAGRTAGSIYAVSTIGSIVGTLGCAFVLLPNWGVKAVLMQLTVATLFAAALCFLTGIPVLSTRRRSRTLLAFPLLTFLSLLPLSLFLCVSVSTSDRSCILYQRDSLYHRILVEEVGSVRYLRFDASYQSAMDLRDPDKAVFAYTDYLHLGVVFKPNAQKVLFIGLGGATAQKKFRRHYPHMTIHTAEIDPAVKEVAEKFFDFCEDEKMRVFIEDGRVYLRKAQERYDLIVLDAYFGSRYEVTLPFHLVTREFWQLARARLTEDGVVVFNLVGRLEGPQSRVTRAILKTMRLVFPELYLFPVEYRRMPWLFDRRNLIVIAPRQPRRWTVATIVKRAQQLLQDGKIRITELPTYAAELYQKPIPTDDVPLLTDDYAPIEFLNP